MKAEDFFDRFEVIAAAPNGVKQLRQLIVQLGIQGRLTKPSKHDTPIETLFTELGIPHSDKERMTSISVVPGSQTWQLPEGWRSASLTELGDFIGGNTPSKHEPSFWDGDVPWASPKDIKGPELLDTQQKITQAALDAGSLRIIPKDSLLMVTRSGILKRTFPVLENQMPCTINQDLKALVPKRGDMTAYLKWMLVANEQHILARMIKGGVTVQSLIFAQFSQARFPVPPIEEQTRIVKQVEDLLAWCDQLEKDQATARQLSETLLKALPYQWHDHRAAPWAHLLQDTVTGTHTLRQLIKRQALMGRLASPENQTPSRLTAAPTQKDTNVGAAVSREPLKPFRFINPHREYEWLRPQIAMFTTSLSQHVTIQSGYAFKSDWFDPKGEVRLLRNANIQPGKVDWSDTRRLSTERAADFPDFVLNEGDIVLSLDRPIISTGLKLTRVRKVDLPALLVQRVARIVPNPNVDPDYLYLWLMSPMVRQQLDPGRSNGVPHLRVQTLKDLPFQPPDSLEEQRDMVRDAKRLLRTVDTLETHLTQSQTLQAKLAEASVAKLIDAHAEVRHTPDDTLQDTRRVLPRVIIQLIQRPGEPPLTPADHNPLPALLRDVGGELEATALWQASNLSIDDFYAHLQTAITQGHIKEPGEAETVIE